MATEKITESFVRHHFEKFKDGGEVSLFEQEADDTLIQKCLSNAARSNTGNKGFPDFIFKFGGHAKLVGVVECKRDTKFHRSNNLDKPIQYAVDGVLHYAKYLAKEFDVLAIAVSGTEKESLEISHFLQFKGRDVHKELELNKLMKPLEYLNLYFGNNEKYKQDYDELRKFIGKLNENLHEYKVLKSDRALLISMILIALENKPFELSYSTQENPKRLARQIIDSAVEELEKSNIQDNKLTAIKSQFEFLTEAPILSEKKHVLRDIVNETDSVVSSFVENHEYRDVLGDLYIEFLGPVNSDKGLGIVLTPPHITDLFADLAEVGVKSIVYDNCAGTGRFLISALRKMIDKANGDTDIENDIKSNRILGVEISPKIYALAVSNMFIHQDGKSNIERNDCSDKNVIRSITSKNPTIGLLNPPYKLNKKKDTEELKYVLDNLECLVDGGTCIALVPMQSAIAKKGKVGELKKKIMKRHTLEAVLSLPDELFFNSGVSVVSCAMIFTAKKPHKENKEVFLGYFKDDGFVKRRIGGRCDANEEWEEIQKNWMELYQNKKESAGLSICRKLKSNEEWSAESYIETDYGKLIIKNFENTIKNYSSYLFSDGIIEIGTNKKVINYTPKIDLSKWKYFKLTDLFQVSGTKTTSLLDLESREKTDVLYPYVTCATENNAVRYYFSDHTEEGQVLTVDSAVKGYCSYQHWNFTASDHVEKLTPEFDLSPFLAMFFVTIINMEQFRFNYGLKCSQERLRNIVLKLPCKGDSPDYDYMEKFVKGLAYSDNITNLVDKIESKLTE